MATPTVLIVEDDPTGRELLDLHLRRAGFRTVLAADADAAWREHERVDLIVLDRMLPDRSGDDLLRDLRRSERGASVPVLMLTARASEVDRVSGLDGGADDYLTKPYGAPELVARLRALLRRSPPHDRIVQGDLVIDLREASARIADRALPLTRREFDLLAFLAGRPGQVFAREDLLDHVWGEAFVGTDRTVDQHVAQLRKRLGDASIVTVRGRGYRWNPDVAERPA
ncbi:MAG: response regulator transcription factor [Trueperaceae bacterium]